MSTFVKTNTMGSLVITDGTTPTPLTLTVPFEQGDFQISGLSAILREVVKHETRGKFTSASYGSRTYPSGSFSCKVTRLTQASTNSTIMDFITGKSGTSYAARLSTLAGEVEALNLAFTMEGTDFGDAADHTFNMTKVVFTSVDFAEGEANTLSFTFEVLGAITGDIVCDEG
jgi:hypothetical protein